MLVFLHQHRQMKPTETNRRLVTNQKLLAKSFTVLSCSFFFFSSLRRRLTEATPSAAPTQTKENPHLFGGGGGGGGGGDFFIYRKRQHLPHHHCHSGGNCPARRASSRIVSHFVTASDGLFFLPERVFWNILAPHPVSSPKRFRFISFDTILTSYFSLLSL